MAQRTNPTLIALGRTIRIYRELAGMIQIELAKKLGYTNAWLSNVETGQLRLRAEQVSAFEEVLGIPPGVLKGIHALLDANSVPTCSRPWPEEEQRAEVLRTFQTALIPDLLQTLEYAHTLHPADDAAVQAIIERQAMLTRDDNPPAFHAVLDEAVLHRDRGAPQVMRDQLLHLVKSIAPPRITIQILRSADNPYPYPAFALATVAATQVGLIPTSVSDIVTSNHDDIAALNGVWEAMRSAALSQRESIEFIRQAVDERWHVDG